MNPSKLGQVHNLVLPASDFGDQKEIYTGMDVGLNARLDHGVVGAGFSTGRLLTDQCFVVDSPQQLLFCHVSPPLSALTQLKIFGTHQLGWGSDVSGTYQNLAGPPITAGYPAPNALIAPSLGRNLSLGATATATVPLISPNSLFEDRINQIDLRVTKRFAIGHVRLEAMVNVYNLFNASPVLGLLTTYGPSWKRPTQILVGRLIDFGIQMNF